MSVPAPEPVDLFYELSQLIAARTDGNISAEQLTRLEELVINNSEARRIYIDYMRDSVSLTWWATSPDLHQRDQDAERISMAIRESFLASEIDVKCEIDVKDKTDGMETACSRDGAEDRNLPSPANDVDPKAVPPRSGSKGIGYPFRKFRATWATVAAIAAMVFFGIQSVNSPEAIARLTKSANAQFKNDAVVGDALSVGEMTLKEGVAQIDFSLGGRATVEGVGGGPAIIDLKSDHHIGLVAGRLAVKVPKGVVGFTVSTPKYRIVDLGTEFAVELNDAGETQVHVFEGRVAISPFAESSSVEAESSTLDASGPESMLLVAGESLVISETRETDLGQIRKTIADSQRFTRDIEQPVPLNLNSTGRGIDLHAQDPNWRVVAARNVPGFTPGQAVVIRSDAYLPNDQETSKWISYNDENGPKLPGNASLTFEALIDLTGFDFASTQITAQFLVDNEVFGCRVNGNSIPVPKQPDLTKTMQSFHRFVIDHGFRSGVNTIQFDVRQQKRDVASELALRVLLAGTSKRSVQGN